MGDLFFIYIMSLLTFAMYGWDKHLAVYNKTRIPELILLLSASLVIALVVFCMDSVIKFVMSSIYPN